MSFREEKEKKGAGSSHEGEKQSLQPYSELSIIHKRAERLASGTYLVTNLLHDKEPLKWTLREKGILLVSNILPLRGRPISEEVREVIVPSVSEIIGYLDIARTTGIMSEMNCEVLGRGYMSILRDVKTVKDTDIDVSFLEAGSMRDEELVKDVIKDIYKRHSIGHSIGHDESKRPIKKPYKTKIDTSKKKVNSQTTSDRKKLILSQFKEGAELTIRDVVEAVRGEYSGKTVQRDLMEFVKEGTLKKRGERRWSRYSLAKSSK